MAVPNASHARPVASGRRWRLATLAAFAAASGLAVTSAVHADGLDIRSASVTDLHTLVEQKRQQVDEKQAKVTALNAEIQRLGDAVDDARSRKIQRQVRRLRGPAGFNAASGPGLHISLSDTPKDETQRFLKEGAPREVLIVHQQDIQGVVNALWEGGAEAISLMGQRIISTTGIKCVGNTVVIKDVPYAPPYEIEAVGDTAAMQQALYSSPWVSTYLVRVSAYKLGWGLSVVDDLKLDSYTGTTDMRYARVATSVSP